ncbi:MAG: hypothetical protein IJS45_04880 [Clostridia bacterium]|nr:hypothetical protein [Clostridia bacterium]
MTILENLWYGNIRPVEQFVEGNAEYRSLLRLVGNNREKLEATLSHEQAELFEKFYTAVNEMHSTAEVAAFSSGFRLGAHLMNESGK